MISFQDYKSYFYNCPTKKGLVVETSLDLIYILPYYFYLVHVFYYFYPTKTNVYSFLFYIPSYDKQRKKTFLSGDLCVLYNVML